MIERRDYNHVIFDWNGTLLDDHFIVIRTMNRLLRRRGLPLLYPRRYKAIFTFPVKEYYRRLGFDFSIEPFEELAIEYISVYKTYRHHSRLFHGVRPLLSSIQKSGLSQSILSASKEEELIEEVAGFNLIHYFVLVAGLDDDLAYGKIERGRESIEDLGIDPGRILLIGDTVHDFEVARELGCDSLLVSTGHQSYERLFSVGVPVVSSLNEVLSLFHHQ